MFPAVNIIHTFVFYWAFMKVVKETDTLQTGSATGGPSVPPGLVLSGVPGTSDPKEEAPMMAPTSEADL